MIGALLTVGNIAATGAFWSNADSGESVGGDYSGRISRLGSTMSTVGGAIGAVDMVVGVILLMDSDADGRSHDEALTDAGMAATTLGLAASTVGGFLLAYGLGRDGQQTHECVETGELGDCIHARATTLDADPGQVTAGGILLGSGLAAVIAGVAMYRVSLVASDDPDEEDASGQQASWLVPDLRVGPTGGALRWTH